MLLTETKFSSLKFSSEFIIFQAYYILYLFIQALLVISFFLKCAMTDWAAAVSLMPRRISSCKTEAGLPHWSVNITNFQFFYGPSVPAERMVLAFVHWFSLANEQPVPLVFIEFQLADFCHLFSLWKSLRILIVSSREGTDLAFPSATLSVLFQFQWQELRISLQYSSSV